MWRTALTKMQALPGFGYGLRLHTPWFEQAFGCHRESNEFNFAMLALRKYLEEELGYYLQAKTITEAESSLRCEVWEIPSAAEHCREVAEGFEAKLRRYGKRAMEIRARTLVNPESNLDEADRQRAEKALEIAATRLVLLRREKGIAGYLKEHAPKLLAKG